MTRASLTFRFGSGRLRASVNWPETEALALALVLTDELAPADPLVRDCVVVGLLGRRRCAEELGALEWLAEHGGDLGPGCDRLMLAGGARAARLAAGVRDNGWPVLHRQVLVHPRFGPENPIPPSVSGVAPATVVHSGDPGDDGFRYAALLRAAGVAVEEVQR